MVLREGKEVDNKLSERNYDREERPRTNEIDCKIESDSPPPSNVCDPVGTHKPKAPYPQALDALFPSRKDKHEKDILELSLIHI